MSYGLSGETRTPGLLIPNQALCQTELHPDTKILNFFFEIINYPTTPRLRTEGSALYHASYLALLLKSKKLFNIITVLLRPYAGCVSRNRLLIFQGRGKHIILNFAVLTLRTKTVCFSESTLIFY